MTRKRKAIIALCVGGALAVCASTAAAHEMFLKPASFKLPAGTSTVVALFNGTYDKSENAVTRDRMASVSVVGGGQVKTPAPSQWRDDAVTSYLDLTVDAPGTYVVGVSTLPKIIELSADNFEEYLRSEGIEDTLKSREAEKPSRAAVRERYSKHVKTIVQAGDLKTDDYARRLGFPAEILLKTNPAAMKVGDTLEFDALIHGQPMAAQLVYASFEGFQPSNLQNRAVRLRTDAAGHGAFKISQSGKWYITLINMQKSSGDAAYESNWATVTFEIR